MMIDYPTKFISSTCTTSLFTSQPSPVQLVSTTVLPLTAVSENSISDLVTNPTGFRLTLT